LIPVFDVTTRFRSWPGDVDGRDGPVDAGAPQRSGETDDQHQDRHHQESSNAENGRHKNGTSIRRTHNSEAAAGANRE